LGGAKGRGGSSKTLHVGVKGSGLHGGTGREGRVEGIREPDTNRGHQLDPRLSWLNRTGGLNALSGVSKRSDTRKSGGSSGQRTSPENFETEGGPVIGRQSNIRVESRRKIGRLAFNRV